MDRFLSASLCFACRQLRFQMSHGSSWSRFTRARWVISDCTSLKPSARVSAWQAWIGTMTTGKETVGAVAGSEQSGR